MKNLENGCNAHSHTIPNQDDKGWTLVTYQRDRKMSSHACRRTNTIQGGEAVNQKAKAKSD